VPRSVQFTRLVVEEGFLDQLDLRFGPGLNVLIGPRGVGKSSIIQLLRFCIGVPAFGAFGDSALSHARDVLGADGRVSVELMVDGEPLVLSRRKGDEQPEGPVEAIGEPIILAQTEVEEIAVDPGGRLRLLDDFRAEKSAINDRERALASEAESLTIELSELAQGIDDARREAANLEPESTALTAAEQELAATAREQSGDTNSDLTRLDGLGRQVASARVRLGAIDTAGDTLARWIETLKAAPRGVPAIEKWPEDASDPLVPARAAVREIEASLEAGALKIAVVQESLAQLASTEADRVNELEDEARDIRRRVDQVQEGAGLAARRLAALRERVAQLTVLVAVIEERDRRYQTLRLNRDEAVQNLEAVRDERFEARLIVAKDLTASLSPQIQVSVQRSGDWRGYGQAIADALRGSGLHYVDLAPKLAQALSPRELARAVEDDDAATLSTAAGIPADRARRIMDRIKDSGLGKLLTVRVEDAIELELLDGTEYKPTEELSTGQRCTTILPILLQHEDRPVVVDQPEDHLDGAFIVDTLVQSIVRRSAASQLIASTHNPNIPVLGDATQVTLLGSDGHRGFQVHSGPLEDRQTVEAITSVMEGGHEAFERRARFYGARQQ
jgi:energy-coupling factor transporter ATP-binding protein EcfA2